MVYVHNIGLFIEKNQNQYFIHYVENEHDTRKLYLGVIPTSPLSFTVGKRWR